MKTLTVVATIVIPLTFVVGGYSMSFAGAPFTMPGLYWWCISTDKTRFDMKCRWNS